VKYARMPMEEESPEEMGYSTIRYNLSESSVRDRTLNELGVELPDMLLFYGEHVGHPGFRELIAAQSGAPATPADTLVTAGAAHSLFIIATTLLEPGDHVVIVRPNYATNIEVPRSIGADITYYDLTFEEGYRVDPERLQSMLRPETKYVNLTIPHNPTGQLMTREELDAVVRMVDTHGCRLLMDETYREMTFGELLPVAATLTDRAISVSSLSKTYGIPGIRMGWTVCLDKDLMYRFLSAKEQIGICNSVVDEEIAYQAFSKRDEWLPYIGEKIAEACSVTRRWIAGEEYVDWVEPQGGVVCFPRITADVDEDEFYRLLLEKYGTYVGPGHWFEQSRRSMRVGYGWPTISELKKGLEGISAAIRDSMR
jgi:aspartate/methionine/tyrosine aminotransferase